MKTNGFDRFDDERKRIGILLLTDYERCIHRSYIDRVPERYLNREYIIDKIYDPKKSVGIL